MSIQDEKSAIEWEDKIGTFLQKILFAQSVVTSLNL